MVLYLLPILYLSISPPLNDVTTLMRGAVLVGTVLVISILRPPKFQSHTFLIVLFTIILSGYMISFIVNKKSYIDFLVGQYGRSQGFFTLIALFLVFIISAEQVSKMDQKALKILDILVYMVIIYGVIQILRIDPISWGKEYDGIFLTLGNPNFAGAAVGIVSVVPIFQFIVQKGLVKYLNLLKLFILGIILIFISSVQGFMIYSLVIVIMFYLLFREKINFKRYRSIIYFSVPTSLFLLLIFLQQNKKFNQVIAFIDSTAHVSDRLLHWELAFSIWQDNKFLGVGLSEMSKVSSQYRTIEMVQKWGDYLYPDKSHNVVMDAFVGGGLFVGIAYILLYLYISFCAVKAIKLIENPFKDYQIAIWFTIWFSYLFQSMISPSHIFIDSMGAISGGYVYGIYLQAKRIQKVKI